MDKCEDCVNYYFDEDLEGYICAVSLDEDEMLQFLKGSFKDCPYYRSGDDYKVVRRQN